MVDEGNKLSDRELGYIGHFLRFKSKVVCGVNDD